MTAIDILRRRAGESGLSAVARELGVSKAAISQILNGKYQASTEHIEARVMKLYGGQGLLVCPHLGTEISPADCAATYERAQAVGLRATGNPETFRQYYACKNCDIRK